MIREVAELSIKPEAVDAFLADAARAVPIFQAAKGCKSMRIERVIEQENVFRLIVLWETLDDHIVTFRESDGFVQWRALVGPHFAQPPHVDHSAPAIDGF